MTPSPLRVRALTLSSVLALLAPLVMAAGCGERTEAMSATSTSRSISDSGSSSTRTYSSRTTTSSSSSTRSAISFAGDPLETAIDLYVAGNWAGARRAAQEVARQTAGERLRHEAEYLAGIAAYRDGDIETAAPLLASSAKATDRTVSGRSWATLGLIDLARGDIAQARARFDRAADRLPPQDARRARVEAEKAASAYRSGRYAPVNARPEVAAGGHTSFTLQVGAFRSEESARRAADDARARAGAVGIDDVRVIDHRDPHAGLLHVVQVGDFPTAEGANDMRVRRGWGTWIVVGRSD